ncbi:MAG TPA: DNA polymerase II, partial [Motiliproteus sp.]
MIRAFLLTQHSEPGEQGIDLIYWLSSERGALKLRIRGQEQVCFFHREQAATVAETLRGIPGWRSAPLQLCSFDGAPVDALYCRSQALFYRARERLNEVGVILLEEDIRPHERYLMERFIGAGMRLGLDAERASAIPWSLRANDATALPSQSHPSLDDVPIIADPYRPQLRLLSLDIETAIDHHELYSIGLATSGFERVLLKGAGQDSELIRYLPDEQALLLAWEEEVARLDPDLIIGWNLIQFDLHYLQRCAERLGLSLRLGRGGAALQLRRAASGQWVAAAPGRVLVDGIEALRGSTYHFESFALESVAQALLGRGKLIEPQQHRGLEISRLYREDPAALAAYNIEDCRLVLEIFAKARLCEYLIERAALTGLTMDRVGGSAAAFDHLYLPRMHRQGYVAPPYASGASGLDSPGGYVMESRPGLYDHVLVLDFKSLYPSIIRSFLIDPVGLCTGLLLPTDEAVAGFNGARFSREAPILPALLAELWAARDQAKAGHNVPLATAIKIIMNAFYGVLGSPQCRFFDQRLSSSITLRGHQVLTESADYVEQQGYTVIYGDTDSLFVWLGQKAEATADAAQASPVPAEWETSDQTAATQQADQIGRALAIQLNDWWRQRLADEYGVSSFLEIEYETHYLRFLMPTIRGSDKGSKKRYAGLVGQGNEAHLVFKGMEAVRSDWTPLARQFQQELYRRVFLQQPYADYVKQLVVQLQRGELDSLLVYRKRLRRPLQDYVRNAPPQVQAARKALQIARQRGEFLDVESRRRIAYLITLNGPEPLQYRDSPLDYQHYIERQLAPVADAILPLVG